MSTSQVFGMYRSTVKRNDDPLSKQRLILQIPQVLGEADSEWAEASDPTSSIPRLGDVIWVQFSGGDVTKPVYIANGLSAMAVDITSVQTQVNTATATAAAAQDAANTATATATAADAKAVTASAAVATATDQANAATAAAATAQTQANTATADAAAAQTQANTASSAAAAASGLAATKAVVLYQTAAPGSTYQNTNTLWIDITGGANTPKKWVSGTTWAAVTDKAATDAAAAAATAATNAAAAQTQATLGVTNAAAAQTQANTATTAAATAQTQANTATADAATADAKAVTATAAAAAAQTQANLGVTNAATAQDTANTSIANAATAQATADGKAVTYIQAVMPTGQVPGDFGDLWFDTNDGYKMYSYSGSAWVATPDTRISTALTNAAAANTAAGTAQTQATLGVTNAAAAQTQANLGVTNAATAQTAAGTAQTQANLGVTNAAAAQTQANLGVTNAATAKTQADLGVTNAATAQTQATLGVTNAALAQTKANTATTDAATASSAAAAASGLAATKAVVLYQSTVPATGDVNTLWIDTTAGANTPKKWVSGTTWAAVTDKAATDAATAAATATTNAATAQTQATLGVTNAAAAQTQANLGVTNAAAAQTQATLGVTNAAAAQTQANTATTAAATAQTQATLGVTNAATATTNAATAQTQANLGVTNAAAAQTAAGTAQTTADSKITTFYQTSAPASAGQVEGNLWVSTSDGNRLYRWTSGAWVTVRDTTIATAQAAANTAQISADGKNKITSSLSAPGTAANNVGDVWWQKNALGNLIGQWEGLGGTAWVPRQLSSEVIASINADVITVGTLRGITVIAGTPTAVAAPTGLAMSMYTTGLLWALTTGTYYYKITGTNNGGETTGSNEVSQYVVLNDICAKIVWDALPLGTTGVKVYRGTAAGAENKLIATLSGVGRTFSDYGIAGVAASPPGVSTMANANQVVKSDSSGFYAGGSSYLTAPFRLDLGGNIDAPMGTITALGLRTGTETGARTEVGAQTDNEIRVHSGSAYETGPGLIKVGMNTNSLNGHADIPYVDISGPIPNTGQNGTPLFRLQGVDPASAAGGTSAWLMAENGHIGPLSWDISAAGTPKFNGGLNVAGQIAAPNIPAVTVTGWLVGQSNGWTTPTYPIKKQYFRQSGTADVNGFITVNFPNTAILNMHAQLEQVGTYGIIIRSDYTTTTRAVWQMFTNSNGVAVGSKTYTIQGEITYQNGP